MLHTGIGTRYIGLMEITKEGDWWYVKKVFHQSEAHSLQAKIRGTVIPNCAKGKRDQAARRTFVTQDSFHKYLFYSIDKELRDYFKDYIKSSDRMRIELCCDSVGMWIDPHYDIPEKSFTMQIYLGWDNVGTTLHLEEDIDVPWIGNCGYAIVRDIPVLHSLKRVGRNRHSVLINYVDDSWKDTSQLLYG